MRISILDLLHPTSANHMAMGHKQPPNKKNPFNLWDVHGCPPTRVQGLPTAIPLLRNKQHLKLQLVLIAGGLNLDLQWKLVGSHLAALGAAGRIEESKAPRPVALINMA